MTKKSKHVKAFEDKHAKSGENVLAWADGYIGEMMGTGDNTQHNGVLIITEERAIFYRKGIMGEVLETMPLKTITSVERKSMLGHRVIRLHTSHDDLSFKTFQKDGEAKLIEAIEAGRSQEKSPEQSAPQEPDAMDKLKKLAELKDSGILTQEEFDAKKAQILESM